MNHPEEIQQLLAGHWTKELPKESGFYWYRGRGEAKEAVVVEWDVEMQCAWFCGSDIMLDAERLDEPEFSIVGSGCEFWSERLTPPPST